MSNVVYKSRHLSRALHLIAARTDESQSPMFGGSERIEIEIANPEVPRGIYKTTLARQYPRGSARQSVGYLG
jgi:hypothetical protein